jgi:hypothetical protein
MLSEEASERPLRSWLHLHLRPMMMRRWQRICIATSSDHKGSSSPSTSAISASGTGILLAEIISLNAQFTQNILLVAQELDYILRSAPFAEDTTRITSSTFFPA